MFPRDGVDPRPLFAALRRLRLSYDALWLEYFAVGGNASVDDLRSWINGIEPLAPTEYDIIAQALNEYLDARGVTTHVPYHET
jgi:hypothetical protein